MEKNEDHQRKNVTDPALRPPAPALQVQALTRNVHMVPARAEVQVFWSVSLCLCFVVVVVFV